MKKTKKFLSIIFAVMMMFSALSANAATDSYTYSEEDYAGNTHVQVVVNGVNEFDDYTDPYSPVHFLEVGTTITIELPTTAMHITDLEEEMYSDGWLVYAFDSADTGACTVTNLNPVTYKEEDFEFTYYKPGFTICFTQPGRYVIETFGAYFPNESLPYSTSFYGTFTVLEKGGIAARYKALHTAEYTNSTVLVNGVPTTFEAYNINGNNYFKLRDLAMALNGTDKQFEVTWDDANSRIALIFGTPYTAVGGELAPGDGTSKECNPFDGSVAYTGPMYFGRYMAEGYTLELKAYTINGNNYFKLRDICSTLNVGVTWDEATSTIGIDTSVSYTG